MCDVVVSDVAEDASEEEDGIESDAHARGIRLASAPVRRLSDDSRRWIARLTLQLANQQLVERFPRLVAVANILKRFGGILACDIEHHLLAAGVLVDELRAVVDLVVDDEVNVLFGIVLGDILVGEAFGRGGGIHRGLKWTKGAA